MDKHALTITGWLEKIDACGDEPLRAYDTALQGLKHYPTDRRLKHRAVISLVKAGAAGIARKKFDELGLGGDDSFEIVTLRAMLLKDEALSSQHPRQRGETLRQAAALYRQAYETAKKKTSGANDAGIEAASLLVLAGDAAEGRALVAGVAAKLRAEHDRSEAASLPERYDICDGLIRACAIGGDWPGAEALIPALRSASGCTPDRLAETTRRLAEIAQGEPAGAALIELIRPAPVVHYTGHIIAGPQHTGNRFPADQEHAVADRIAALLDDTPVTAAYGSLAAGADILFAEALLARKVALHVVLPFRKADFIRLSVAPSGTGWIGRFENCLAWAIDVRYATDDDHLGDDHLFEYGAQLAMGLAVLMAEHLQTKPLQLALWDGRLIPNLAGTVKNLWLWCERAGHERRVVRCGDHAPTSLADYRPPLLPQDGRITRAMLFGDINGFSKLSDGQIPAFTEQVMKGIAATVGRYARHLSLKNSWGDGIFLVFDDAGQAADCALAVQDYLAGVDLATAGLPSHIALRIGGHLGPTYQIEDPFLDRPNYYGAHVSRAARIEPSTPEGCIYVTEPFAAVLALHNAGKFACDYVGITAMAKKHGETRMFLLRRR